MSRFLYVRGSQSQRNGREGGSSVLGEPWREGGGAGHLLLVEAYALLGPIQSVTS